MKDKDGKELHVSLNGAEMPPNMIMQMFGTNKDNKALKKNEQQATNGKLGAGKEGLRNSNQYGSTALKRQS